MPKPTALRVLEGNPGKRPLPVGEPKPEPGLPTRPEWLSPEAKREWTRLVDSLPPSLLTKVDRALFASWCQCWADYVEAVADIREDGWTFKTESNYEASRPAVARMHKALEKLITLSGRLGLSPADRARLTVPERGDDDANPFDV